MSLTFVVKDYTKNSDKYDETPMAMELIGISRRIIDTPNFVLFAVADGLFSLAARSIRGIAQMLRKKLFLFNCYFGMLRVLIVFVKRVKLKSIIA